MKRLLAFSVGVSLLSGCEILDTGAGGGNIGTVDFTKGIVFVKKDDRNIYISDENDYTKVAKLTQTENARHPSLSWDGRQVVYVDSTGANAQIKTVLTSGGTPSVLVAPTTAFKNFRNPVFSRDGKTVVFAYDDGAASAIGLVNSDGSGLTKLAGSSMSYASPSFDNSGDFVYVAAGSSLSLLNQIERIEVSTGTVTTVASALGSDAKQIANRLVISPDGRLLAFDGRLASGSTRLFVMNVASQAVTQSTEYVDEPGASDSFPTWVGTSTVAFGSDSGGAEQVYEISATDVKTTGSLILPSAIEPWFGPN